MRRALVPAAALAASIVLSPFSSSAPAGGATQESVEIKASDGVKVQGTFHKPSASGAPGVLLVHDAGGDRTQLDAVAERLSKQGFGVLSIDLRGHGASRSEKLDWQKFSADERKNNWVFAQRDVDAGAGWLLDQPCIRKTSLSLVGYGSGSALVVRHAKSDENVVCLALLAPNVEDYGFDVRADIQTLEGLPTCVVTSKDAAAERMAIEANASSSNAYVEVFIAPAKVASPLEDKAMPGRVSKWLADKAVPKKGKK
jgi:dienelactone hydrolase